MEHLSNLELLRQLKECQEAGHFPDGSETPEIYEYREKEGSPMGEAQWLEQTTEGGHDSL